MSTIIKKNDPSSSEFGRQAIFATSSSDFVQGDVLNIVASLLRPGSKLVVETGAGASVAFRLNSITKHYPPMEDVKRDPFINAPDFEFEQEISNPSAPSFSLTASSSQEITSLPIENIEIDTLVVGGGTGVTFTVY